MKQYNNYRQSTRWYVNELVWMLVVFKVINDDHHQAIDDAVCGRYGNDD